jgi:tetratricopeptide (TPR) repeat protein
MLSSHQLPKAFLIPSVDRIRQLIPSAQIDEVNIESADGKVLAQRYGVQALPVFFFSESAVHCKNFPFIAKLSTQPYPHEWFVVAQSIVPNPGSVYGTVNVAESGGNVFQFPLDIQAVALQRINHLDDALGAYQKYLSEYPDDPTAIANIGQLFYDRGDKLDAIKSYQRAINLKPDYLLAAENLERACNDINDQVCENFALSREGSILAKQQDWLGSIKKYQAALEIEPGAASTHFRLGAAYMNIGQLDNAVRHLERARELDPSHVEIITMLGKTLWNQGEREDAIKALDNAIALKPMDIVARSELASALEQMDRMDDAIAILQGETSVSNPNPVIAKKLLTLLEVQKRNAEAAQIGHGFMTHSILASDRELWYLIAHAEFACGDRASAVADIKNCSLESSTDPSLAESIGEEFVKMGMLADAQAAFDFVVTHTPANSLAHANLALIHYSTDKEGAAAAAERDLAQQFGLSSEQWRSLRESFLQSNPGNETLVPTAISSK